MNYLFPLQMSEYRMKYETPYLGKINQHCKVSYLTDFSSLLERYGLTERWGDGCFSQFSCLKDQFLNGKVILNILNAEVVVPQAREDEMWFRLGRRTVRFGPREFILITGLHFGDIPDDVEEHFIAGDDSVYARYFSGTPTKINQVYQLLETNIESQRGDDVLKMMYVTYLCHFLMGREIRWFIPEAIWGIVEDLQYFESFPWGTYIYSSTLFWLRYALADREEGRKGKKTQGETQTQCPKAINIYGFVFSVQVNSIIFIY